MELYLGIDIGGTNIKAGLFNEEFHEINRYSEATLSDSGSIALISQVINLTQRIISSYDNVDKIGIGIPGVVNSEGKIIIAPNFKGFNNIEFGKVIRSAIKVPVAIDNDANAAALAELYFGSGHGEQFFLYLTLGTGIGCGIIYEGRILRGSIGGAGEIGHTFINSFDSEINLPTYRIGTLEKYTGKNGIIECVNNLLSRKPASVLNDYNELDVDIISNAAKSGDETAIKCIIETGRLLGIGIASAVNLLDIPIVIIGGGISQCGDLLFGSIRNTLSEKALPSLKDRISVREALFSADSGIIGSALLGKYHAK